MKILHSRDELFLYRNSLKDKTFGFVPTMGALHNGHLSLVEQSIKDNDITVCSIFVNPTQFDNSEDLEKYPRNTQDDIEKLQYCACDILYLPSVKDLYPENTEVEQIELNGLDEEMEGKFRKGHFAGVATVVKRLFLQILPNKAYFGEKDFQQLQIVKQMTKVENLTVEIIGMPIIRENNGLAMSSRNQRLTSEQRNDASIIYKNLCFVKEKINQSSIKNISEKITKNFALSNLVLEYFLIVNEQTLKPVNLIQSGNSYRAFIAAYAGKVRLIDNLKIL